MQSANSHLQDTREGTATASWLQAWGLIGSLANSPHASRYLIKLAYLRAYVNDMAYATPSGQEESTKHFRRRLYTTLHTMATAASTIREIRVVTTHPTLNWPQIWRNLQAVWVLDDANSAWFMAIHDIIPTNDRLFKIHLADTNRCNYCAQTDTLSHRMAECNAGKDEWEWTRGRLAVTLRTNKLQVPAEWPLWSHFHIWPPQRHGAILWILAHLVHHRTQHCHQPTLADYADFMRRAR